MAQDGSATARQPAANSGRDANEFEFVVDAKRARRRRCLNAVLRWMRTQHMVRDRTRDAEPVLLVLVVVQDVRPPHGPEYRCAWHVGRMNQVVTPFVRQKEPGERGERGDAHVARRESEPRNGEENRKE